jgi:hypothetical protein
MGTYLSQRESINTNTLSDEVRACLIVSLLRYQPPLTVQLGALERVGQLTRVFTYDTQRFSVANPIFSILDPVLTRSRIRIRIKECNYFSVLRIRIRDPGSGTF